MAHSYNDKTWTEEDEKKAKVEARKYKDVNSVSVDYVHSIYQCKKCKMIFGDKEAARKCCKLKIKRKLRA